MGAVVKWIEKEYSVYTHTIERTVVLNAATAVQVLQNNPDRFAWRIFNMSAGTAYLGFSGLVAAGAGIQVNPTGGSVGLVARDDMELPTHDLWGIATAAVNLTVFETVVV